MPESLEEDITRQQMNEVNILQIPSLSKIIHAFLIKHIPFANYDKKYLKWQKPSFE